MSNYWLQSVRDLSVTRCVVQLLLHTAMMSYTDTDSFQLKSPTLCHKLWQSLTGILHSNSLSKRLGNIKEKKGQINFRKSSHSLLQLALNIKDNVNVQDLKKTNPGYALCTVAYARLMPQDKTDKVLQNVTSRWILFTLVGNYACKNRLFRQ